jgi:hypothetical protein
MPTAERAMAPARAAETNLFIDFYSVPADRSANHGRIHAPVPMNGC